MKITYTGTPSFPPAQQKKLDARFGKLAKLLDSDGNKDIHVIVKTQRHLQRAEITVNYYNHPIVGLESDSEALTAILGAAGKLEKQILKQREKWRDTKRTPEGKAWSAAGAKPAAAKSAPQPKQRVKKPVAASPGKVFRINSGNGRKPMTLDEAMIEMDGGGNYTVYRDADTDRISVLVRRKDGHFDLIES